MPLICKNCLPVPRITPLQLLAPPAYLTIPLLYQVFATVHDFYVNYLRNPFSALSKPVHSDKFRWAVDRQIKEYNS